MCNQLKSEKLYTFLFIILILTAIAIRGGAKFNWLFSNDTIVYNEQDIQCLFPEANDYEAEDDHLEIYDKSNTLLGHIIASDQLKSTRDGYGGKVPLFIGVNMNNKIIGVHMLANEEGTDFIEHLNNKKLLDYWNKLPLDTNLIAQVPNAVSGATISSNAVIKGFTQSVEKYLELENQRTKISVIRIIQVVLWLILLALSVILSINKKLNGYYFYYLLAVFTIMGLYLKKMLSLETIYNWLTKDLPWQSNWQLITVLGIAISMAIIGQRKFYCNYLCPMGAVQILVSKISPFKKQRLPSKLFNINLRTIILTFIWSSLLLGISLPFSYMEPFVAFSFKVASWLMIAFGGLIVLMSLFFNRPWCSICPTGALLNCIPPIKKKF